MKARLHSRMLLGFCGEGFLATVTMTARLLRHAKMPQGAGFIVNPIQPGSPQISPFSAFIIFCLVDITLILERFRVWKAFCWELA